jgi:hypothetical protein
MVTGLFNDRQSAERAFETLNARGYGRDDVNLVMSDETRKAHFGTTEGTQTELGSKAAEGAGVGGAIGGTVGAILADCRGRYHDRHPGAWCRYRGPTGSGYRWRGRGRCRRGLVGALVGWGIPEERVKRYETGIKKGGILMGVRSRSDEDATFFAEDWKKTARPTFTRNHCVIDEATDLAHGTVAFSHQGRCISVPHGRQRHDTFSALCTPECLAPRLAVVTVR